MRISQRKWREYTAALSRINKQAGQDMVEYANRYGLDDRDGLINYGMALVQKYGEGSSELACEMYDTIARLQNADVEPAEPADLPEYGEVARSINGALKQSPDGKLIGDPVSRLVKRAGADTMLHNAKRDGAEFAWIPSGDSCAFCTMIASRGWQRASKKTIEGDHADHIHANCQCEFAIRFSKDMDVAGYHPEKLREEYDNAADGSWRDKLNAMRREMDQQSSDEKNEISDKEYISAKIESGEWGKTVNAEKQAKHSEDTHPDGASYFFKKENPQEILDKYSGTGYIERDKNGNRTNKEVVMIDHDVGIVGNTGEITSQVKIHHSKSRTHLTPIKKKNG